MHPPPLPHQTTTHEETCESTHIWSAILLHTQSRQNTTSSPGSPPLSHVQLGDPLDLLPQQRVLLLHRRELLRRLGPQLRRPRGRLADGAQVLQHRGGCLLRLPHRRLQPLQLRPRRPAVAWEYAVVVWVRGERGEGWWARCCPDCARATGEVAAGFQPRIRLQPATEQQQALPRTTCAATRLRAPHDPTTPTAPQPPPT